MKHSIFTESYRGFPVTVFWIGPKPYTQKGALIYGYRIEDDLEIESIGFANSILACRHAGKVIDQVHAALNFGVYRYR